MTVDFGCRGGKGTLSGVFVRDFVEVAGFDNLTLGVFVESAVKIGKEQSIDVSRDAKQTPPARPTSASASAFFRETRYHTEVGRLAPSNSSLGSPND
jgi:hypothetical protein